MNPDASLKDLGDELLKLTDVKPDTMRLIVPQISSKGSKLLSPFSKEHSQLNLHKAYVIELNPPASEALKRMHMLAADPGIVAIMKKHHWHVGIMTELAPVGYVGVTPKCILGFNKNHGEEISLRLRTDDLKGFRKYESIKKTLLHELAHMVYSEHDANFYALDKQLNQEAASLDWTKSTGHTLNGFRHPDHYEEEFHSSDNRNFSQKLGGNVSDHLASARSSSVAAAYRRLANASANSLEVHGEYKEPDPDDSRFSINNRLDIMDYVGEDNKDIENPHKVQLKPDYEPDPDEPACDHSKYEPDPDDSQSNHPQPMETLNSGIQLSKTIDEPDPDDSETKQSNSRDRNIQGPDLNNSIVTESMEDQTSLNKAYTEPDPDESQANITARTEPDPDDDLMAPQDISGKRTAESMIIDEPDPDDLEAKQSSSGDVNIQEQDQINPLLTEMKEPDPDESQANKTEPDPDDDLVTSQKISSMKIDEPDPDEELQRIQDPVTVVCGRLQKAVERLRAEVNPTEATGILQILFKIIRNVIEHPNEMKFKKLRKANPIIQKNVANHKAAMEILQTVGFIEDVVFDETGKAESCLVLKRNDPGLLWLAKSSLEACVTC
ncbi:hypothetical protein GH714_031248 [Hevea brasiliensis]|uniref:WLM domain-containing protein n=1 Tax=Hevea brasiliensis TaxID=3981 RepID=A0A6A6K7W5_HEVBR|nr:hypothetical protein GH714_031248 [Hevea brasiliensis]